ncbi:hypothetical protein KDAU_74070 [Dictyobacter aurantiacus]|uniref:Uncharacterized protein n=1 Tax=Dictyobacter aurantiacus TaxID=1936993 RepID=A0A401ZT42_9CHLR|nr:hypothetical protein KDAU_74070 [Dictyobacter aurantiacus]
MSIHNADTNGMSTPKTYKDKQRMQNYFSGRKRRSLVTGTAMLVLLTLIIVGILQAPFWQAKAAVDTINPHQHQTFYHVPAGGLASGSTTKYNDCTTLDSSFKSYVQALGLTYGPTEVASQASATAIPVHRQDQVSVTKISGYVTLRWLNRFFH